MSMSESFSFVGNIVSVVGVAKMQSRLFKYFLYVNIKSAKTVCGQKHLNAGYNKVF